MCKRRLFLKERSICLKLLVSKIKRVALYFFSSIKKERKQEEKTFANKNVQMSFMVDFVIKFFIYSDKYIKIITDILLLLAYNNFISSIYISNNSDLLFLKYKLLEGVENSLHKQLCSNNMNHLYFSRLYSEFFKKKGP